jgi:hypothetical protein
MARRPPPAGLTLEERVDWVAGLMTFPALTVMVFLRRRLTRQRTAEMVASQFCGVVHA